MKAVKPRSSGLPSKRQVAPSLLDAARAILVSEGLPGLSVRRVAEQAGCTTMAVYTQFAGKPGIVAALYDEVFERLAEAQAAVPAGLAPHDRICALCHTYRVTAHRFPHHYALMLGRFSGEFTPAEASAERALATLKTLEDAAAAALLAARQAGDQRRIATEAQRAAHVLFALCHGWVSLELAGVLPDSGDEGAQRLDAAVRDCVTALLGSASPHKRGPSLPKAAVKSLPVYRRSR
jgi:AcrR family transcriptional regulator